MLGASNDQLDFIISLAGPGVNGRDVVTVQNRRMLEASGASQAEIDANAAFVEELFAVGDDPEAIEALAYEQALEQIEAMPEDERARLGDAETYADTMASQVAEQYAGVWFQSFLTYDPAPDWAQTTMPVLALFGGKDAQVDAAQNAPVVNAALAEAGNTDYAIVVLPEANHLFQAADTGAFTEYSTLPAEFTPDLLPTIITWLHTHVTIAE